LLLLWPKPFTCLPIMLPRPFKGRLHHLTVKLQLLSSHLCRQAFSLRLLTARLRSHSLYSLPLPAQMRSAPRCYQVITSLICQYLSLSSATNLRTRNSDADDHHLTLSEDQSGAGASWANVRIVRTVEYERHAKRRIEHAGQLRESLLIRTHERFDALSGVLVACCEAVPVIW
jgi:hypothetical protein